jgi:Mg-chelatase subunit ChlD
MPKDVVVQQEDIEASGSRFTVTRIPTATSGSWFVVHDAFEIWAAVAIDDMTGEIIGWRNPPTKSLAEIENAVKKAFGIPVEC